MNNTTGLSSTASNKVELNGAYKELFEELDKYIDHIKYSSNYGLAPKNNTEQLKVKKLFKEHIHNRLLFMQQNCIINPNFPIEWFIAIL